MSCQLQLSDEAFVLDQLKRVPHLLIVLMKATLSNEQVACRLTGQQMMDVNRKNQKAGNVAVGQQPTRLLRLFSLLATSQLNHYQLIKVVG